MSSIEELQKRVSEAEQRFGLIKAQRAKYSERLVGLIDAIEARLRDQHAEIERQAAEIAAQFEELNANRNAAAENQALRGMLHSLLRAIETGGRDVLNETMQLMDAKVSTLIQNNVKAVPALGHASMDEIEADLDELEASDQGESATLESSEPASGDTESPEFQDPELQDSEPEIAELEPEAEGDALSEIEQASEPVGEAIHALEDELPEAAEVAADDFQSLAIDEPVDQAETFAETEQAVADETAFDEALEAIADGDAPEAAGEDDAMAALDAQVDDSLELGQEPDAILEDAVVETPEPAAEEAMPEPSLDAYDDDAVLAEEAPVEAEAAPETEIDADLMAAEPVAESEMTDAADSDPEIGDAGTLGGLEDPGEAATLEEIMRRVSRLVEEEGTLGKPARGSVRIGADASAAKPKAASNG